MIKNFTKGLAVAVCAAGFTIASCSKQNDVVPSENATSPVQSEQTLKTTATTSTSTSTLKLGINGHPFGDAPYLATPAEKQVELIKGMGMNWYRINIQTMADGTVSASSTKLFPALRDAAKNGSVNLLPMLYLRTFKAADNAATSYEKGRILGGNFAAKYGDVFEYYNLGNDLELGLLISGKTGREASHYDAAKVQKLAAYLKGMDEGIKANDPGAKTMVDAGWIHWGFLNALSNNGVKFDAIGYHWYSDMEGAAKNYKITDITKTLSDLFPTKELWFTEYGFRYKSSNSLSLNETNQSNFINSFVTKCRNNPKVKVAIAYELFDEPYKSYQESNYGVYKWASQYTHWNNKGVVGIF
ncbi:glycosyl hydrolase 53 family protein [Mucilaginibacter sp. JRF]|uniref:glycosyl hydrolase 53 family protein n=1 Tax=Mucilaginibacter sp. JRF TaxID=2780088 RepID=UPI00188149D4|nr:glycosyl hydrolase 53 family protein [Mucilaginibacter sp. JRF]MBE9585886.1 glycosyl hydrolase 53 family protein [Mucilaginibacter sp. JRF]